MRSPCADRHRPGAGCPRLSPAPCAAHPTALRSPCDEFSPHRLRLRLAPPLHLEVEINTREPFAVPDFTKHPLSVKSRWCSGSTGVASFELDQLLAIKMRALYQRRKGRGLFDMAMGLADKRSDAGRIEDMFRGNVDREDGPVIRAMFERNLAGKLGDTQFNADMSTLLRSDSGCVRRKRR